MKDKKTVSIMIPCYNGEKYLPEFLESLISQGYPSVEVIFADDGSTDGTALIYRKYEAEFPIGWSSKYIRIEHSGQAAAIAEALKNVTGEYLMWSDADDIMLPGSISRKADFLECHPEYRMVRNDFVYYYPERGEVRTGYRREELKGEDIFEAVFDGTMPCLAGTYMMESALMFECYPDRQIPLSPEGQNFQLLLPPCSRTKCGYIDEPLMKYRIHTGSHSNRNRRVEELFSRAEGFLSLRKKLLDYCVCDRAYFTELARKLCEAQKHQTVINLIRSKNEKNNQAVSDYDKR